MSFVYASGSDLIESRNTQKSGKRMIDAERDEDPCLAIEPHRTRARRAAAAGVAAMRSVSTRVAISPCS